MNHCDKWLKTKEAAKIIGMAQGSLANRSKAGAGPACKKIMRFLMFMESSVMEFAEQWQAIHKRDKPVKRPRSKTKKVTSPRFCKGCGKEIANRKFFYCSKACLTESKNRRQREYNHSMKDNLLTVSSEAICPRCGKHHKVYGWTGKTKPKTYCHACRQYVN